MGAYEAPNFTSVRGRAACHDRDRRRLSSVLGLAAATGAPALLLICGCCGLVEPSRRSSAGSEPSADHSRCELEPQDQVAGDRLLLHVGGRRGLLPGLESATAKISGSGRSGVPPNMSTCCIPSGVARSAAQPEYDMALQHHPTRGGARAPSARRCRKTHTYLHHEHIQPCLEKKFLLRPPPNFTP